MDVKIDERDVDALKSYSVERVINQAISLMPDTEEGIACEGDLQYIKLPLRRILESIRGGRKHDSNTRIDHL